MATGIFQLLWPRVADEFFLSDESVDFARQLSLDCATLAAFCIAIRLDLVVGVSPLDSLYHKKRLVLERIGCPVSGQFAVAASTSGIPTTPPLFNFLRVFHMDSGQRLCYS